MPDLPQTTGIVYHGTHTFFDTFFPLSHFGTFKAALGILHRVYDVYDSEMGDKGATAVLQEYERLGYRLGNVGFVSTDKSDIIVPARLKYARCVEIPDLMEHEPRDYAFLNMALCAETPVNRPPLYVTAEADYIGFHPFEMPLACVRDELAACDVFPVTEDETLDRRHLGYQRAMSCFTDKGIDVFAYRNEVEDKGSFSFIAVRPECVRRLDKKQIEPQDETVRQARIKQLQKLKDAYLTTHRPRVLKENMWNTDRYCRLIRAVRRERT